MSDLVWAVTDGPDGLNAVSMPEDRYEALALKATHSELFWCGTAARGCGARLIVAAGPKNRPHFRHHVGSGCRFIDQPYRAGAAYEHLQYQRSLQRWLEEQGYRPTLERHLREDGRTDLHVVVEEVAHIIEVQLSPLSAAEWQARDTRYRRHARHVTWLYGSGAEGLAATELALRGMARMLQRGPEVGARDVDEGLRWCELADCRLTVDGFVMPGTEEALALAAERRAQREDARRQAELGGARRQEAETRARQEAAERRRRFDERQRELEAVRPAGVSTAGLIGLEHWEAVFPEARFWSPARGWEWLQELPPELQRAAKAMAYATQELAAASPTATILPQFQGEEDRRRVLDLLEAEGFITRYVAQPSGIERWRRGSDPSS